MKYEFKEMFIQRSNKGVSLRFHCNHFMQTKQRDNESRLYYQALKEHRIILGDLQTKDAFIRDQQKKIRELEAELIDFVHAYDVSDHHVFTEEL